jgi:hypothetical protein
VLCKYYKEGIIESGMKVADLPVYLNPSKKEEITREMLENPDIRALDTARTLYRNPNIKYDGISLTYTVSDQLLNLVTSLDYDPDRLRDHVAKLEKRYAVRYLSQNVRSAKKMYSYHHLTTKEFVKIRNELLDGITTNTFNAIDLISAMNAIRFLAQQEEEFTGITMARWAEIETVVLSPAYSLRLPEGDQRASEYDFIENVCSLAPDATHPLYCKFYSYFSQHQLINAKSNQSLPDLTASPILTPQIPGPWKGLGVKYLEAVKVDNYDQLINANSENHDFWIKINDFLFGLRLGYESEETKKAVDEFAKRVEAYASTQLENKTLSEARLFKNLAEVRKSLDFNLTYSDNTENDYFRPF